MKIEMSTKAMVKVASLSRRNRRALVQILRSIDPRTVANVRKMQDGDVGKVWLHQHREVLIAAQLREAVIHVLDCFEVSEEKLEWLFASERKLRKAARRAVRQVLRAAARLISQFEIEAGLTRPLARVRVDDALKLRRTQQLRI